ncbi:MAG TPA: hypothetical protein VJI97_01365 [Candidatus Nanoarchaeia archaeon]|nr:hypothetical protein [Candidatus Nanoarchaeia archaeon]
MPVSSLYTCTRCKREFNFDHIKYDEEKKLICVECLEKQQKIMRKKIASEKPDDNKPIDYICMTCRFKFVVKKGSPKALKCPYCSKTKLMVVKRYKDENDLISDAMNSRFDH